MKVKDLVKALQELDQELEVITAKDAEGNGYNSLYYLPSNVYCPELEESWIDTVYYEDSFDEYEDDHDERPIVNCVVL